jgi:hypothetical protein
MTIVCTPDLGIPMPKQRMSEPSLPEGLAAACATAGLLQEEGLSMDATPEDVGLANEIIQAFAAMEGEEKQMPVQQTIAQSPPAALLLAKSLLDQYSHAVVESAVQLRHLVTNKLIIESDNPDAKVRIRALELLGKISDVGLFTERSEVVITHQSSAELEDKLREKLRRLMGGDVEDADVVAVGGGEINLVEELGLDNIVQPGA